MQLVYYKKLESIEVFDPNTVVLIGESQGPEWRDHIAAIIEYSNRPDHIYALNVGARNYNHIYFLKYIQYKHACDQNFHAIMSTCNPKEAELFFLWERIVSLQDRMPASDIQNLQVIIESLPFFSGCSPFILYLRNRALLASDRGIIKHLKAWKKDLRNELPFPHFEDAHQYLRQVKYLCDQLALAEGGIFSRQLNGLIAILNQFIGSSKISDHYLQMSILLGCLAGRFLDLGLGEGTILLSHRSVDFYLASLCKDNSIEVKGRYMMGKYDDLVARQVLHSNQTVKGWLDELNRCRNQMFLAHGGCSISLDRARCIYDRTYDVIKAINGNTTLWEVSARSFSLPPLELLNLFSFSPGMESYFTAVSCV